METQDLLRAFISSETKEFEKARLEIAAILRSHRVKPVYWEKLEKPSALTTRQFYLEYLRTCQLYIGILGTQDSPGTEDDYREATTIGLDRLIFIKDAPARGSQIHRLIQLAEKDVVREKFTTDQELVNMVDERIQNWLSNQTLLWLPNHKRVPRVEKTTHTCLPCRLPHKIPRTTSRTPATGSPTSTSKTTSRQMTSERKRARRS